MRFVLPTAFLDPRHFADMATAADDAGWWAVTVSDHVIHPEAMTSKYPYVEGGKPYWTSANPWPDPWVTIAAMAAVTERVRFMTNVFILPARNPFLVAKAVGTAAVLSADRVALGIGVGWMKEEFELLEQSFAGRGKRTDEAIEILRRLWSGGMVEYQGECYAFGRVEMSPAPRAKIPIYAGGLSDRALDRAARLCDGWISVVHTVDEIRDYARRLHDLRRKHGRDRDPFEVIVACTDAAGVDGYKRLADAGATAIITVPWLFYDVDAASLAGKCDAIRRYGEEIIHRFD